MKELPPFDGSLNRWSVFYSSYMESRILFSDVGNRNRLKKALKGKALKAVSGFLLSPSSVDGVYILEYRVRQTEQIIQMKMLIPSIKVNIETEGDQADMVI